MTYLICPECGAQMILRETNKYTYGDGSPRKFYGCTRFPECKAAHGAHPDGKPLGIPANKETKEWRIRAHAAFDDLWKSGKMKRGEAYVWLAKEMSIHINCSYFQIHIGELGIEDCQKVIRICTGEEVTK